MALPKIFFQLNLNMKFWSGVICVCSFLIVVTHCQTSQPDCDLTECNQCLNSSKIFLQCNNKTCHCVEATANSSHVCGNETSESSTDGFFLANSTQSCESIFSAGVLPTSSSPNITESATTNSPNGTIPSTTATLNVSTSPETPTIGPTAAPNSTSTSAAPNSTAAATTNATPEASNVTTEATIITAPVNATTESTSKTTEETGKPESSSTLKPAVVAESRHFDGASFIGGMILAVGLIAISYVGLKFYRSRTENNYHTLREAIHM